MAFTAAEVANIANATLDFYMNKGDAFNQSIQKRPLLSKLESKAKTFPGGKGDISVAVQGDYGDGSGNDVLQGFTHDDTVNFYTPANIKRANYPWREHHLGLTLTYTELKHDGLSVMDENGADISKHSRREMTMLINLLDNKFFDMGEQYARSLNLLLWGDGTADAKALAGIQSMITDDPSTGTVGGIDRAVSTWWQNRALTAANSSAIISSTADGGALATVLQSEWRQLRRYGGNPDCFFAGSDFVEALEKELRANGTYSETGFTKGQDMAVGQMKFKGVPISYDPTLDDLGQAKYGYWLDSDAIFLDKMENEWKRTHTPARPVNQFVLHRSLTSTGQVVGKRMNSCGVYQIT